MLGFGAIGRRDVCLVLDIIGLDGAPLLVLKDPQKKHLENSAAVSLSRNHDLVIQEDGNNVTVERKQIQITFWVELSPQISSTLTSFIHL